MQRACDDDHGSVWVTVYGASCDGVVYDSSCIYYIQAVHLHGGPWILPAMCVDSAALLRRNEGCPSLLTLTLRYSFAVEADSSARDTQLINVV